MKKTNTPSTDGFHDFRNARLTLSPKNGRATILVPILLLLLLMGTTTLAAGCGSTPGSSNGTGTGTETSTKPGTTDTAAASESTSPEASSATSSATSSAASSDASSATNAASPEPSRSGTKFPDFSMKDLDGNTVDQSLFANKDLTMVNIWGTFCPPCIDEMPALGKLAKVMASDYNAQLVGIVVDITDDGTLALSKEILGKSDATHLNLIPDQAVTDFLKQFEYVPTTLFVDKEGYIVSQPVVGGHSYADYLVLVKDLLKK